VALHTALLRLHVLACVLDVQNRDLFASITLIGSIARYLWPICICAYAICSGVNAEYDYRYDIPDQIVLIG